MARTFASITGKNVVVDPRVKGTLTLVIDQPVSRAVALSQFVAALRLQGFTLVEASGLYKVVPEARPSCRPAPSRSMTGWPRGGGRQQIAANLHFAVLRSV